MDHKLFAAIDALYLQGIRQHLHQHPELSQQEYQTQQYICDTLTTLGVQHRRVADTGVVATIEAEKPGKRLAFRADIDALPIEEEGGLSYRSVNKGISHACGHDAHTAILIGTIKHVRELGLASGKVTFVFQPDEEKDGGARRVINDGCLDGVDAIYGLHVMPYLEVGDVEFRYQALNASSDTLSIELEGKASHAAYPHEGKDAIVIMAGLIMELQTIVSRSISPLENGVLSFGLINGGTAHNVLAGKVVIKGTLRTFDRAVRDTVLSMLNSLCKSKEIAYGVKITIDHTPGYPMLINDDGLLSEFHNLLKTLLPKEKIHLKSLPSLGVEDFSYYLEKVPGVFFHLGCRNRSLGITHPLHSAHFNIDEDCLPWGTYVFIEIIRKHLGLRLP